MSAIPVYDAMKSSATHTHLQQQDEVIHWVVACIEVVVQAKPVGGVKVHFLVDTGMTKQMEEYLL